MSILSLIRKPFRSFPAISRALSILILLNAATFGVIHFLLRDPRPSIFLLGDSCIGNYRPAPGARVQDFLQRMEPGYRVVNLAEPGANALDFTLLMYKGFFFAQPPRYAVFTFAPDKLVDSRHRERMDESGANLRWLPLNRDGLRIWKVLSPQERNTAVVQKIGLGVYGFTDIITHFWVHGVQWPQERKAMQNASPERHRKIMEHARRGGLSLDTMCILSDHDYRSQIRVRDFQLLLNLLHSHQTTPVVIIHPQGNPALLARVYSPSALARCDLMDARLCQWLSNQNVSFDDLTPNARTNFPDSDWDDAEHLKAPAAFFRIARTISAQICILKSLSQSLPHVH